MILLMLVRQHALNTSGIIQARITSVNQHLQKSAFFSKKRGMQSYSSAHNAYDKMQIYFFHTKS